MLRFISTTCSQVKSPSSLKMLAITRWVFGSRGKVTGLHCQDSLGPMMCLPRKVQRLFWWVYGNKGVFPRMIWERTGMRGSRNLERTSQVQGVWVLGHQRESFSKIKMAFNAALSLSTRKTVAVIWLFVQSVQIMAISWRTWFLCITCHPWVL